MGDRWKKRKRPKSKTQPTLAKIPGVREQPRGGKVPYLGAPSSGSETPSWRFRLLDIDGPYCPTRMTQAEVREVRSKLADFETMTWGEIEGRGNHFIPVDQLTGDAQHRLGYLQLDDTDEVFSLRLSGKERVFGLREGAILRLLWWDPDHEVCPSELKHT